MIHDIFPRVFHNEYRSFEPDEECFIICFSKEEILVKQQENNIIFPQFKELSLPEGGLNYLFSIDEQKYFLLMPTETLIPDGSTGWTEEVPQEGYRFVPAGRLRDMQPRHMAFAAATAFHVYRWYADNRFCGRCGKIMYPDDKERLLRCPECSNLIYPRISPAVIVGIVDHNRILMTRYAGREYRNFSLVAGFTEIGESQEQTVKREVLEEVGLEVKNIRYYKSQPWPFSGTLLSGFFVDLDGNDEITLDEEELSEATWFDREEIPIADDGISLTREMIQAFKENKY